MFLARTREEFLAVGVDVMVQEALKITMANIDLGPKQSSFLVQANSLDALPRMIEQGMKFDVMLLDGDHNYHTVSQELKYLDALINPTGIVLIDDVYGRWSERDLWYVERPGYEENKLATPKIDTEKHGVKTAVDEWLVVHPTWSMTQPIMGEPVMLTRTKP